MENNNKVYALKDANNENYFYYLSGDSISFTKTFDNAFKFHKPENAKAMMDELTYHGYKTTVVLRTETYEDLE